MNQKRIYELRDEACAACEAGTLDEWYNAQPAYIDGKFNEIANDLFNLYKRVPRGATLTSLFLGGETSVKHWRVLIGYVGQYAELGEICELGGYLRTLGIFSPSRRHEWAIKGSSIYAFEIAYHVGMFLYNDGNALKYRTL